MGYWLFAALDWHAARCFLENLYFFQLVDPRSYSQAVRSLTFSFRFFSSLKNPFRRFLSFN